MVFRIIVLDCNASFTIKYSNFLMYCHHVKSDFGIIREKVKNIEEIDFVTEKLCSYYQGIKSYWGTLCYYWLHNKFHFDPVIFTCNMSIMFLNKKLKLYVISFCYEVFMTYEYSFEFFLLCVKMTVPDQSQYNKLVVLKSFPVYWELVMFSGFSNFIYNPWTDWFDISEIILTVA